MAFRELILWVASIRSHMWSDMEIVYWKRFGGTPFPWAVCVGNVKSVVLYYKSF